MKIGEAHRTVNRCGYWRLIGGGKHSYENRLCSLKTNEKEYHYSITIVSAQIYSIIFIYLNPVADGLLSHHTLKL
jgi:hypothetical protein